MPLEPGTTLGPYSVTAKIGEGGMGAVYRARDTKLDRDVALKVLPEAFTSDPDRLARFEREAKVLASLNHPNIGAIHGFEESGDTKALVLELVEGPTLADRIAEGPIPIDDALPIAKQIAEALEAAHEQGVIHRDLKPANVKVKADGTVKVLDFGLAKAFQPGGSSDPSDSPTITASATASGVIMGTAAYMSPEQARGKPVDKRSDIWAFGAVLYEMLSGHRPFEGRDVSEVLGAVLRLEPDWDALPGDAPPRVSTLVRRCIEKEPKQRLHDMADVRLAMEGAFETRVSTRDEPIAVPQLQIWQRPIPLTVAVLGLVILTGLGVWSAMRPTDPPAPPVRHFALDIGPASPLPGPNLHAMPAWSPDGTQLVYAANVAGTHQLYLRSLAVLSLDTGEQHIVVEDGYNARYLPTGHLVFGRQGALWGVPFDLDTLATTGPEEVLLQGIEVNEGGGAMALAVSGDGTLVYRPGDAVGRAFGSSRLGSRPVWVDRTGQATPIPSGRSGTRTPRLSPDNTKLAVTLQADDGRDVWVDDLERGTSTRLTDDGRSFFPAWSLDGDRVFFGSDDPRSFGLYSRAADGSDERETILTGDLGMIPYSWTPDGQSLTFYERRGPSNGDIWTVSRDGERSPYLVTPFFDQDHDLSPDGAWMAYASDESGQREIYIQRYPDLGEKVTISSGGGAEPLWSPSGRELFYRSPAGDRTMVVGVETEPTLRVSRPELLFAGQYEMGEGGGTSYDVSADGQRFLMLTAGQDDDPEEAPDNTTLILVENWFEELKRLAPTN